MLRPWDGVDHDSDAVPDTLRFAPIFTAGLRAYANLGPLVPELPWLKGSRITLSVNNIGNHRQRVRDGAGLTPLRYQPGYRDPIGRIFEIEFRKVF